MAFVFEAPFFKAMVKQAQAQGGRAAGSGGGGAGRRRVGSRTAPAVIGDRISTLAALDEEEQRQHKTMLGK